MDIHKNARTQPFSRALLINRVNSGWTVSAAAESAGLSERRAYEWRKRAERGESLSDRSSRPATSPRAKSQELRDAVIAHRRNRLTYREISAKVKVSLGFISHVLRGANLHRLTLIDGPLPPPQRYEWDRPGFLHLDIKKLGCIDGVGKRFAGPSTRPRRRPGWEYLHVAIDDHSRVAYSEVLTGQSSHDAAGFLDRAVAWYRTIGITAFRVLTDNGGCYISNAFRDVCARLHITRKRTRPYTPRTNGKAERFIQTLCREWAYRFSFSSSADRSSLLIPYLHFYNHHRQHSSLGRTSPLCRLNNVPELHS